MSQMISARSERKGLSARRLTLLASAAGLAVFAAGPSGFGALSLPSLTTSARADVAQPHAGFADIVAKVKPSVISVRVKMDEMAKRPV